MQKETVQPTSIRLPPKVRKALDRLAAADERSFNNYVVRVLSAHIQQKGWDK
jgi:predicted HicB family RNase H-like nuclease